MQISAIIAEWVAAISTFGALIAAIIAALYAKRSWETERRRDAEKEQSELRAQAELVAPIPTSMRENEPIGQGMHYEFLVPAVTVINRSNLPIFDIVIEKPLPNHQHDDCGAEGPYWWGIVAPGEQQISLGLPDVAEYLISDELKGLSLTVAGDDEEEVNRICDEWSAAGRPTISFTDSAGRRWRRADNGTLSRDKESPMAKKMMRDGNWID